MPITLKSLKRAVELTLDYDHLLIALLAGSELARFMEIREIYRSGYQKIYDKLAEANGRIDREHAKKRYKIWREEIGISVNVTFSKAPKNNQERYKKKIKELEDLHAKKRKRVYALFGKNYHALVESFLKRYGRIIVGLVYKTRSRFVKFQD